MIQDFFSKIAKSSWFQITIIVVIILAGILVGLETYRGIVEKYGTIIHFANNLILWIFVIEIIIKMAAEGRQFWRYFKDPWNIFDFTIVAVCFVPINAQYIAVLRLARILRILKLITAIPKLQILVGALLKSIPSMIYVTILLMLQFYIYAVMATFLFAGNDPVHFGSLELSMLSLFRVVTLEDWTDIMYIQMYGSDVYAYANPANLPTTPIARPVVAAIFFVSFVLFGTMIVLNLFIGVIMNGMDEARKEEDIKVKTRKRQAAKIPLTEEIEHVQSELETLKDHLAVLQKRIQDEV